MRPHRLEKPSKLALYFSYSVIIGIPIQTGVCSRSSFRCILGAVFRLQEKLSPAKSNWSWKVCWKTSYVYPRVIISCNYCGRSVTSGRASLFARGRKMTVFCNKSLYPVTCLREPNHMPELENHQK